jgi:hypothetical protein
MAYQPAAVKAEDSPHTSGDSGQPILGVRNDTRGTLVGTDLDYAPVQLNSSGDLRVDGSAVTQPISGTVTASNASGDVAAGVADSGNPVKVGGKYNATPPALTDGNRGDLQLGSRGSARVELFIAGSASSVGAFTAGGDAASNSFNSLAIMSSGRVYNGSTWDRQRNNEEATLLASAARTTTQTGADITNYQGNSGLIVVLDVTSAGTGSITLSIEGKDSASGKYYTILSGSAVTTNSTNRYRVGPTLAAAANSVAQDYLPRVFRIVVTANNANSITYSVGYCLVRG